MGKWSEIKVSHFDEYRRIWAVDAWKTASSNEEGRVIAEISEDGKTVKYLNKAAETDPYAQEVIIESMKAIRKDYTKDHFN